MEPELVSTRDLTKRYGALYALRDCNLTVQRGEVFGLLGPNGAGKSTLIRLLLGYIRPTSGRAAVEGRDCYRDSVAVHRRLAYLPGEARLQRTMRGRDVLKFFAELRQPARTTQAFRLAERLELDLSRRVAYMSTGMRQKLALALTLAADVPLFILDEPTSNLDPDVRREVIQIVRECRLRGCTVIFSSHVLSEVEEACDRLSIIRAGRLVHTQSIGELRRQYRLQAEIVGSFPDIPASLAELVTVHLDGQRIRLDVRGELRPLLRWLADLPIHDLHIEPIGLQAVYEQLQSLHKRPAPAERHE